MDAAKKVLAKMSLKALVEQFELTSDMEISVEVATVRGWLMDAIESKNPEGYDKWLDESCEDEDLRKYVL